MTGRTARRRGLRVTAHGTAAPDPRADLLAVEEPLEIRVGGQPLSVTIRTPGDDLDLTAGFLAAEGIVATPAELTTITMCRGVRAVLAHRLGGGREGGPAQSARPRCRLRPSAAGSGR